jgi:hypothetical protein
MKKGEELNKTMVALAKEVQSKCRGFYLAGGTSIMIKYKHRISFDLDFFKDNTFSYNLLIKKVTENFNVQRWEKGVDNIDFFINNIKVSFVFFPFKNVEQLQLEKDIKMASDIDLFLNKIYVAGRRIDSRDPFDAAYLYKLHNWDNKELKHLFEKKFVTQSYEIYLGAILNFDDYEPIDEWIKETLRELAR